MGNQQRSSSLQETAYSSLNLIFCSAINGARRVIQDQDPWIGEQGTGYGYPLALSTRESDTALSDDSFVAIFKTFDKDVGLSIFCGLFNGCLICLLTQTISNVLRDGA